MLLATERGDTRPARGRTRPGQPRVLLLSSSLLTDRMILHTGVLSRLQAESQVEVWAKSLGHSEFASAWHGAGVPVRPLPEVGPFREFPHNYARRLNELTWDYRLRPPSRLSMMRHVRDQSWPLTIRMLKAPARMLAMMGAEESLEGWLEDMLLRYRRSPEAGARLAENPPSVVVTTNPFWFDEPGIVAEARRLGIPVIALIPSWDNVTTKPRMVFRYAGYLLWSDQGRLELETYYPAARRVPMRIIGAPQFDVFFQDRFRIGRDEFCRRQGLDPSLPFIVYAVGSPNFLKEHHGAIDLARRVSEGALGAVQMVVRPHPIHDRGELESQFRPFAPRVVLQGTPVPGSRVSERTQDEGQIIDWVNTFRHAAVVVNLSSTVTVDAALNDVPVVNLDYDPAPGSPQQDLVRDINHLWDHFKPVAESGGVWLTNTPEETAAAVRAYLNDPALHREGRRQIVRHVCGYADGRSGVRFAEAVLDFVASRPVAAAG